MSKKKVAILGGGISGLSLAWYLSKKIDPSQIVLIEKAPRLGGWIETYNQWGFLFERGPRTFRPSKSSEILELIEDVGILDQIIAASNVSQVRYIVSGSELKPFPRNPIEFFRSPLTRGMIPALLKEWLVPSQGLEDESIYDFVSRRLNRQTALRLFDPLTLGIYAGDIRNLSMKSCFPSIFELEQNSGTLTKGILQALRTGKKKDRFIKEGFEKASLFTLRYGMQSLIDAMQRKLEVEVQKSTEVVSVHPVKDYISVETSKGNIDAEKVYFALPLPATAHLLKRMDPNFSFLEQIPCASLLVVHLGYNRRILERKGFGYLVPSEENDEILGMIWDSDVFPEQNADSAQTRLTVMMGGMIRPDVMKLSDGQAVEMAKNAVLRHMNVRIEPRVQVVTRAPQCIPQFEVGYHHKLSHLQKKLSYEYPKIQVAGNFVEGVSVNDCVKQSKILAEKHLEKAPI